MAAEIFKVLSNLRMVLDTETDADSPDNETTYPAIRQMIESLFILCFGCATGSLTSDPPDDTTGWAIDTGAGFADDQHNSRTLLMTSGDGKGLPFTIDDTEAANNRVECAGDNLYADGIRSGDDYVILYDIKNNADGHDHDDVNSKSVVMPRGRLIVMAHSTTLSTAETTPWATMLTYRIYLPTNPTELMWGGFLWNSGVNLTYLRIQITDSGSTTFNSAAASYSGTAPTVKTSSVDISAAASGWALLNVQMYVAAGTGNSSNMSIHWNV